MPVSMSNKLFWSLLGTSVFLKFVIEPAILANFDAQDCQKLLRFIPLAGIWWSIGLLSGIAVFYLGMNTRTRSSLGVPGLQIPLATWVMSLTIYGAWLLPAFTRAVGRAEAALITRPFSMWLNLLCLVALGLETFHLVKDLRNETCHSQLLVRLQWAGLLLSGGLLILLFWLHADISMRLEAGPRREFLFWHKVYLLLITLQWLTNLGLLIFDEAWVERLWLRIWSKIARKLGDMAEPPCKAESI